MPPKTYLFVHPESELALATWIISLLSIALVLMRPKGWPEAIWPI
jgi:hypothetical protein